MRSNVPKKEGAVKQLQFRALEQPEIADGGLHS